MKASNFLVAGIVGGIVDFLLGWLLYGYLLVAYYPASETMDLAFIALSCLFFGLLISYIFVRWGNIIRWLTGLQAGAVIGLLLGIAMNFFKISSQATPNYEMFAVDVAVGIVIGGLVGAAVAAVNGGMSKTAG